MPAPNGTRLFNRVEPRRLKREKVADYATRLVKVAVKYGTELDVMNEYNHEILPENMMLCFDEQNNLFAWSIRIGTKNHKAYITRIDDEDIKLIHGKDFGEFEYAIDHIKHWRAYLRRYTDEGWVQS